MASSRSSLRVIPSGIRTAAAECGVRQNLAVSSEIGPECQGQTVFVPKKREDLKVIGGQIGQIGAMCLCEKLRARAVDPRGEGSQPGRPRPPQPQGSPLSLY